MKILIADDELDSRDLLRRRLEKLGHEVTSACDGAEAWEMTEQFLFCKIEAIHFPVLGESSDCMLR